MERVSLPKRDLRMTKRRKVAVLKLWGFRRMLKISCIEKESIKIRHNIRHRCFLVNIVEGSMKVKNTRGNLIAELG